MITTTLMPLTGRAERPPRHPWSLWLDRLVGADPGLVRLRAATQTVVTLALIFGAEWLFVRSTHALQIDTHGLPLPPEQAALIGQQHHAALVMAMLVGGIAALTTAISPGQPTARGQLIQLSYLPIPMIGSLALGLAVNDHRVPGLILMVAATASGTFLSRFGPWGFHVGAGLFSGYLTGFLSHGSITVSGTGWLAAEIGLGVLITAAVQFTLFLPRPSSALRRTQRSFAAHVGQVARLALDAFDHVGPSGAAEQHRLDRALVRLNESALIIDGQLATPGAVDDDTLGRLLHERIFDIELAAANLVRFAGTMGRLELTDAQRAATRRALGAIHDGDLVTARAAAAELTAHIDGAPHDERAADLPHRVIPHRFANTVQALADALDDWLRTDRTGRSHAGAAFTSSVRLAGGALLGSAMVSAQASMQPDRQRWNRRHLPPYLRWTIQLLVAASVAVVAGDALSGAHFYWAVLAVMVTAMGANSAGERFYKGALRLVGTVIGIGIGFVLAHAVGHHDGWAIVVGLVALFFAVYLMRVNYACWVIGLVVALAQVYVQLGEFTNTILLLRLAENALGVAIMMIVSACVLPLRTRHVLRVALREHTSALAALVRHATDGLLGDQSADVTLRGDIRRLDLAHQTLLATGRPVPRWLPTVDTAVDQILGLAGTCRSHARDLAHNVTRTDALEQSVRPELQRAGGTLVDSITALAHSFDVASTPGAPGTYVRSAALFEAAMIEQTLVEQTLSDGDGRPGITHGHLALRDLVLIDQATAALAEALGRPLANYDTAVVDS